MLFISDNKKIDSLITKLQPSLKLKINIERDFDCGLNDVFEKRPDVVLIQNQIAGVTGESVARHIQMLLGVMAPKFILIHGGDVNAKPIKGLYDHLVDLSQDEEIVAADILNKLNQVLGPRWQTIFSVAAPPGGDSDAVSIPSAEAPAEIFPPFDFDNFPDLPAVEPAAPVSPHSLPIEDHSAADFFADTANLDIQRAEMLSAECKALEVEKATSSFSGIDPTDKQMSSPAAAVPDRDNDLYAADLSAAFSEIVKSAAVSVPVKAKEPVAPPENLLAVDEVALRMDRPPLPVHNIPAAAEALHVAPDLATGPGSELAEASPAVAREAMPWTFDGEPRLRKKSLKWYQFFELLLVLCLLVGGWYFIKHKPQAAQPGANQPTVPAPQAGGEIASIVSPLLKSSIPSFIPLDGLDPAFAVQNPGWERYVGAESEFRLFHEKGALKAVQVKSGKGHVISDTLLKEILIELTGAGEYQETSREEKFGFQVAHATVHGKAELLIYRKNSTIQAVVVSLD